MFGILLQVYKNGKALLQLDNGLKVRLAEKAFVFFGRTPKVGDRVIWYGSKVTEICAKSS